MEASIGNGLAGYFTLNLTAAGVLVWSDSTAAAAAEVVESVAPSAAAWETFAAVLERLDVFDWLASYEDRSVLDGTYWAFSCSWASRTVDSSGANAYPAGFDELCAALTRLVGGRSFR